MLISPTPIAGPDRSNKSDNPADAAFTHDGNAVRQWLRDNVAGNFFIACGDRHWPYHSVHTQTVVHEFSCGPASNQHAGGSPGLEREYHRFHRIQGGFLSVNANRDAGQSRITFRFHDVNGTVVYSYARSRPAR